MHTAGKDIYIPLLDYLSDMIKDRIIASRVIEVFIIAEIPLQTFAKTINLYRKICLKMPSTMNIYIEKNYEALKYILNDQIDASNTIRKFSQQHKISVRDFKIFFNDPYLIIMACCVISCKYFRDISFTNDSWIRIAQIDLSTLNKAERISLILLEHILDHPDESDIINNIEKILLHNNTFRSYNSENNTTYEKSRRSVKKILKTIFCLKEEQKFF